MLSVRREFLSFISGFELKSTGKWFVLSSLVANQDHALAIRQPASQAIANPVLGSQL